MNMIFFDGEAIRRARKAQGLTLEALAAIIGSSKIAISRWGTEKVIRGQRCTTAAGMAQPECAGQRELSRSPLCDTDIEHFGPQRLFETAAEEGLNITQLFETVGTQAVRKAVEDEWRRAERGSIRHNNEELEKNGLWSDGLRLF